MKTGTATAAVMPRINSPASVINFEQLRTLSAKDFEKLTGRHLSFKEKVGYRFLKWQLRRQAKQAANKTDTGIKAERHSKNALVYGIATWSFMLLGLAFPVIGLLAIPTALAAVIFGSISLNKTKSNTSSVAGIILGGLYLLLLVIGLALFL